jgi:conjugative transfer signal peptidase TraF
MKVTIQHARAKLTTPLYVSACACMVLLLLLKVGCTNSGRFAFNTTASLSRGLYTLTSTPTDPNALFCPSGPDQAIAIERGYRDQSGECPDGYISLLKPIAARSGDTVVFCAQGVSVNGILLPNSAPQSVDRYKRPLSHWPYGTYVVAPGTFWAISTHNRRSYDSRYFGPVSVAAIKRYAHPTVVFP